MAAEVGFSAPKPTGKGGYLFMEHKVMDIYSQAIREALEQSLGLDPEEDEVWVTLLFPIWRQAVHGILVRKGCGCNSGDEMHCFLHLSTEEQIHFVPPDNIYSFFYFLSVIKKGRADFYRNILNDFCPVMNA